MTDEEIKLIKVLIKSHTLVWCPDDDTAREIRFIGDGPEPTDPGDIKEPGPVGYLHRGYIALWNADPAEIKIIRDIAYMTYKDRKNET